MEDYSFIDMHIHTEYSDEELCDESPEHILEKVQKYAEKYNKKSGTNKKCLISFTDHNSVVACIKAKELLKSGKYPNVDFITGCEFTTALYETRPYTKNEKLFISCHLLGYNFDPTNPEILSYSLLTHLHYSSQDNIGLQICAARREICEKYDTYIPFSTLLKLTKLPLGADFQNEMFKIVSNYFSLNKVSYIEQDLKDIINKNIRYLFNCTPTYIEEATSNGRLKLTEVVKLVKDAGGDVVLAHPGIVKMNRNAVDYVINGSGTKTPGTDACILGNVRENEQILEEFLSIYKKLTGKKLDGIELYHQANFKHKFYDTLINICKKHKMFLTCGSDYHGENFATYTIIGNGLSVAIQNEYKRLYDNLEAKQLYVRIASISGARHFKDGVKDFGETVFVDDKNAIVPNSTMSQLFNNIDTIRKRTSLILKGLMKENQELCDDIEKVLGQLKKLNTMFGYIESKLDDGFAVVTRLIKVDDYCRCIYPDVKKITNKYRNSDDNIKYLHLKQLKNELKNVHENYKVIIEKYPEVLNFIADINFKNIGKRETTFDKVSTLTFKEHEKGA